MMKYLRQFAGLLPEGLKSIILMIIDSRVRSRFIQDIAISRQQHRILSQKYSSDTQRLIIFLVPGSDIVNGGIMSICSLCRESKKLKQIHKAEVLVCSLPENKIFYPYHLRHRQNRIARFTKFKNDIEIFDFWEVLHHFKNLDVLTIHIPELYVGYFIEGLLNKNIVLRKHSREVVTNIMLQNIRLIPSIGEISNIKILASKVTCTTAHDQYTSQEVRDNLGCPLHLFSVWASPELYLFKSYSEKKDLLVVSPDPHPSKQLVLESIKQAHPLLEIRVVENITYETFKQWMSDAKWTLTFGEGLDGYLGEGIFSGAIGFAVYNEEFFTKEFSYLETIYKSYEHQIEMICNDIDKYNDKTTYERYQKRQYEILCSLYDNNQYVKNITNYYLGKYDYP
jgi:hypothetical protein